MTDLFNTFATYLHDVFVIKFDGWVILGFVAHGFFTMRFVVQWIASERARKSVIPVAFWSFSIGGGALLLVYALYRRDPVFIAGQALGLLVYIRHLYFIIFSGRQSSASDLDSLELDDFSSNRHPTLSFCLSMISAQTLRVCREGKPVP